MNEIPVKRARLLDSVKPLHMAARPYQVVVYGATGFVGNLVCEQLLRDYQVLAANLNLCLCSKASFCYSNDDNQGCLAKRAQNLLLH